MQGFTGSLRIQFEHVEFEVPIRWMSGGIE